MQSIKSQCKEICQWKENLDMALLNHHTTINFKWKSIFLFSLVMLYIHIVLVQSDIRKNPIFRQQFHEMCAKVGVDPLASNKGVWAELLGIGDFYYELGWYSHFKLSCGFFWSWK